MSIEDVYSIPFDAPPLLPNGGILYSPKHRRFGGIGNGEAGDFQALSDCFDAAREEGEGRVAVDLGAHEWLIDDNQINLANVPILSTRAKIIRSGDTNAAAAIAQGTLGDLAELDADAIKGTNSVQCAAIASAFSRGDIAIITSDDDFSAGEIGVKQGEPLSVRFVADDTIYFDQSLNDTYLVSSGAKIAKVTPAFFNVIGTLEIVRDPSAATVQTRGLDLAYVKDASASLVFDRCTRHSLLLNSCWRPFLHVRTRDTHYNSANNAYGVSIAGPTAYGRITGTLHGARHAVMHGGAPAIPGVPWWNVISAIGQGSGGSATSRFVFDAHASVGAIIYAHCVAMGGSMEDESETTLQPSGFTLGARYNYLIGCKTVRCQVAASVRGGSSHTIKVVDINDLVHEDGALHGFNMQASDSPTIEMLRIKGLRGNTADGSALMFQGGVVQDWEFADIGIKGARLFQCTSGATLPAKLKIGRGKSKHATPNASIAAVTIGNGSSITSIHLIDGENDGAGELLDIGTGMSLELVELIGVDSRNISVRHIDTASPIARVRVVGGDFEDGTTLIRTASDLGDVDVAPSRVADATVLIAGTTGAQNVASARFGGNLGSITTVYSNLASHPQTPKTSAYTATRQDRLVLCDATGGAFTVTLPSAASMAGHMLTIKKVDASADAVTVDGTGSETIDGGGNVSLAAQYDAVTVMSDGTAWHVMAAV